MKGTRNNLVISCLLAGFTPIVIAPLIWPIVVLLVEGHWPEPLNYLYAVAPISFFAGAVGVVGSIAIGVPVLYLVIKLDANKPIIVSILGAIAGFVVFLGFGPEFNRVSFDTMWPLAMFFSVLGAGCGYTASQISRPN